MPRILKRPRAEIDLAEIWEFIAGDSPARADSFLDRLDHSFHGLAGNPRMGRARSELSQDLRSFPFGHYVIFLFGAGGWNRDCPGAARRARKRATRRPARNCGHHRQAPNRCHDQDPKEVGDEPPGDKRPLPLSCLFQLFEPLEQIDAAFGFAFLDVEVAFEILVLGIFRDFSKGAQLNWDGGTESPLEDFARWNKANMGAGEIDPGGTAARFEIRRGIKARIGEIGGLLERSAGENG